MNKQNKLSSYLPVFKIGNPRDLLYTEAVTQAISTMGEKKKHLAKSNHSRIVLAKFRQLYNIIFLYISNYIIISSL